MTTKPNAAAIIEAHQNAIWRYLRLLGCDESEADDLTQETFVILLSKPFTPQNEAATFTYLRNTARFAFLTYARKSRRFKHLEEIGEADAVWAEYEGDEGESPYIEALRKCVQLLPERSRAVLELQFRDHAPGARIAEALSLSTTNVKKIVHRSTTFLRECVKERMSHE